MNSKPSGFQSQPTTSQDQSIPSVNDSMLLPHERVGNDFSWLQATTEEETKKEVEVEDEESFLYGNGNDSQRQPSSSLEFAEQSQPMAPSATYQGQVETSHAGQHYSLSQPLFRNLGELLGDLKPHGQGAASTPTVKTEYTGQQPDSSPLPDVKEVEKIKNMMKHIGLNLGTSDISKIMSKLQEQKEAKLPSPALPAETGKQEVKVTIPAFGTPNVQQALVSLQSLIKGKMSF